VKLIYNKKKENTSEIFSLYTVASNQVLSHELQGDEGILFLELHFLKNSIVGNDAEVFFPLASNLYALE
jgi:hypothetical protein